MLDYKINALNEVEKLDYFIVNYSGIIKAVITLIDAIIIEEEIKESPHKNKWDKKKQAIYVHTKRNMLIEEMKKFPVNIDHNIPIHCMFELDDE